MDRLRKVSRFCQICFFIVLFLLPAYYLLPWVFINELHVKYGWELFLNDLNRTQLIINWPVTLDMKITGFVGYIIYVSGIMAIFYFLTKLFGLYARGQIFTRENVHYIRLIGYAFIWKQILVIFSRAILLYTLTMNKPLRKWSIEIRNEDHTYVFIGLIIILISWIMDEGRKLQEEQSLTI